MNNQAVHTSLSNCKCELENIRSLLLGLGEAANPVPYIKKYAVIRATGTLENGFKTIIADRVDQDSHQQLKNYVAKKIRRSSTNPKLESMENLLKEFDEQWRVRFKEKVALSDKIALVDALDNLVETRNSFAHGGSKELNIDDTIRFFQYGCDVLKLLDETVHEEVDLPEDTPCVDVTSTGVA